MLRPEKVGGKTGSRSLKHAIPARLPIGLGPRDCELSMLQPVVPDRPSRMAKKRKAIDSFPETRPEKQGRRQEKLAERNDKPRFRGQTPLEKCSCLQTCGPGLHSENFRVEDVCKENEVELESKRQLRLRLGLLQVCQQHVRARLRPPGRNKDLSGHHRCLSHLRPKGVLTEDSEGAPRMGKDGTTEDSPARAMGSDSCNVPGASEGGRSDRGGCNPTDVHRVPASGGGPAPTKRGPHPSAAREYALQLDDASSRAASAVKGGALRRKSHAGLSPMFPWLGPGLEAIASRQVFLLDTSHTNGSGHSRS